MKYYIYPYNPFSQSAKDLARALGIKRIKHDNSRFRPTLRKGVINWGASQLPFQTRGVFERGRVGDFINAPEDVARTSNKLAFFELIVEWNENLRYELEDQTIGLINTPSHTTNRHTASELIYASGAVVERQVLNGSGGRGCRVVDNPLELQDAPLYVQYIKKKEEFRVHIMNGEVFHVQRKARVRDRDDVNWQIRNHQNGFVYQINDIEVPDDVTNQALKAMAVSGLDFGAVDVIWNDHYEKAYVLEINTAPGIIGATLQRYADAFRRYYNVQ